MYCAKQYTADDEKRTNAIMLAYQELGTPGTPVTLLNEDLESSSPGTRNL